MENLNSIIKFIKEIEQLKDVKRTAWTKTGREESTAEHSWRLAVLAMALEDYFPEVNIKKAINMCLIHDLGEIYEGDVSAKLQQNPEEKLNREEKAMKTVLSYLPEKTSDKLFDLWVEYNECKTKEAKLIKALDKIETIIQHNQGNNPEDFDYEFNLNYGKKYSMNNEILEYIRKIVDDDTRDNIKLDK